MKKFLKLLFIVSICLSGCDNKPTTDNDKIIVDHQTNHNNDHVDKDGKNEETSKNETSEKNDDKDSLTNDKQDIDDNSSDTSKDQKEESNIPSTSNKKDKDNQKETAATKALKKIKDRATKKKASISIAYIGFYSGDLKTIQTELKKNGISDELPFISNIKENTFLTQEGDETYIIIPNDNIHIDVHSCHFDFDGNFIIDDLIKSFKEPFILKGNISDIMPNYYLKVYKGKKIILEYSPCLSLMDGKLSKAKGIYDITPYDKLPFFDH